ncbi:MAG: SufD family Fe-S cluster assembly protein, partial [Syntrophobacterales bacterium]
MSEIRKNRAESAKNRKAAFGTDVDLLQFQLPAEDAAEDLDLEALTHEDRKQIIQSGVDLEDEDRSGTFVQADHRIVHCAAKQPGLEVLPMAKALEQHRWLEELYWQAVSVDADKYTAQAELHFQNGYFIRALAGQRVTTPIQACLYMRHDKTAQNVHNIVIAEEGSELNIITGCTTAPRLQSGLHIGISEFYVRRGAKLTFTMIH